MLIMIDVRPQGNFKDLQPQKRGSSTPILFTIIIDVLERMINNARKNSRDCWSRDSLAKPFPDGQPSSMPAPSWLCQPLGVLAYPAVPRFLPPANKIEMNSNSNALMPCQQLG